MQLVGPEELVEIMPVQPAGSWKHLNGATVNSLESSLRVISLPPLTVALESLGCVL